MEEEEEEKHPAPPNSNIEDKINLRILTEELSDFLWDILKSETLISDNIKVTSSSLISQKALLNSYPEI